MDTSQIQQLIRDKMRDGLSEREVARQAGVGNSTINRILNGQPISLSTLQKVALWLEVKPTDLITSGEEADVGEAIAALIAKEPALGEVLLEAVEGVNSGAISPDVLREIVRYASWRLGNALDANKPRGALADDRPAGSVPED